jgi:hypothetical protein
VRQLFLIATLLGAGAAHAAELRSLDVDYEDGHYTMASVVWFDAGLDETYHIFSSWDLSVKFSSAIVEARDLEPDESGRPGFLVVNKGCVLFFCKTLKRRGYVEREASRELRAFADPEQSDFRISNETWSFAEHDGGTVITYTLLMQPDFWVPPGIGPYMIQRKLRNVSGEALNRIELMARDYAQDGGADR